MILDRLQRIFSSPLFPLGRRSFSLPEGQCEAIATPVSLGLGALGHVVAAQGMGLDSAPAP